MSYEEFLLKVEEARMRKPQPREASGPTTRRLFL
jgi:hypothetical protein